MNQFFLVTNAFSNKYFCNGENKKQIYKFKKSENFQQRNTFIHCNKTK